MRKLILLGSLLATTGSVWADGRELNVAASVEQRMELALPEWEVQRRSNLGGESFFVAWMPRGVQADAILADEPPLAAAKRLRLREVAAVVNALADKGAAKARMMSAMRAANAPSVSVSGLGDEAVLFHVQGASERYQLWFRKGRYLVDVGAPDSALARKCADSVLQSLVESEPSADQ